MEHVSILLLSIILIAGLWAASYSFHMYRTYRFAFLRYLVYYIICFNISVFLYQIFGYINVNLMEKSVSGMQPLFVIAVNVSGLFVQVGLTYTFIQCLFGLRSKNVSKVFSLVFFAAVTAFVCLFIIGIIKIMEDPNSQWLAISFHMLSTIAVITINVFLIMLLLNARKIQNISRKKSVQAFGWLYFIPYLFYFIATLPPFQISGFIDSGALVLFNIVPIIWIHKFFPKYYGGMAFIEDQTFLNDFAQQHEISQRELEVIKLLLQAKTNKEIQEILFISFNTVKNHIYNIYQKLGVSSRGQLWYHILESKTNKEPELH